MKQSTLLTLESLFKPANNIINTSSYSLNWSSKRLALNIIWGLLNLSLFTYGSILLFDTASEMIWFISVIVYAFAYWIISASLFDFLIGHEIDHLNGILFIDHISRLKREMILKKAIKEYSKQ